jgi:hypothetical protein
MYNVYDGFKKYAINDVKNMEEFLQKYTKHDRHYGRGEEYAKSRIKSYQEKFDRDGFTFMSRHESVTGQIVSFYK